MNRKVEDGEAEDSASDGREDAGNDVEEEAMGCAARGRDRLAMG